jgi:hypothetical protein
MRVQVRGELRVFACTNGQFTKAKRLTTTTERPHEANAKMNADFRRPA